MPLMVMMLMIKRSRIGILIPRKNGEYLYNNIDKYNHMDIDNSIRGIIKNINSNKIDNDKNDDQKKQFNLYRCPVM